MLYLCCDCPDTAPTSQTVCRYSCPCHAATLRHTDECVRTALTTRQPYCIAPCAMLRRATSVKAER